MATLATETWTGTDGNAWPGQWTITGTTGTATIQSNTGQLLTPANAFTLAPYAYLSGMTATADVVATCTVALTNPIAEEYVLIALRADGTAGNWWIDPTNGYGLSLVPNTNHFIVSRNVAGVTTQLTNTAFTFTAGATLNVRFQIVADTVSVYLWYGTDLGTWTWTGTDATPYLAAGKVWLSIGSGAAATVQNANFDTLTVADAGSAVTPYPFSVTTPVPRYRYY